MHSKPFASINFPKNLSKLKTVMPKFKTLCEAEVRGTKAICNMIRNSKQHLL